MTLKDNLLSDDELFIMIAKESEEAKMLLFSFYETRMRYESEKFQRIFHIPIFDSDDIFQEIAYHFFKLILVYDKHRGSFYMFWHTIVHRDVCQVIIRNFTHSDDSRKYTSLDDKAEKNPEIISTGATLEKYELQDDSKIYLNVLNNSTKGKVYLKVIQLWMHGYTYEEIGKMLNMKVTQVASCIRRGLAKIRHSFKILNPLDEKFQA